MLQNRQKAAEYGMEGNEQTCVSVVEAEPPERKDVAGGELDAVLDDVASIGGGCRVASIGGGCR